MECLGGLGLGGVRGGLEEVGVVSGRCLVGIWFVSGWDLGEV